MKLIKRNTKYTIIISLVFLALYFLQENKTKADNTEGQQTEQIEKKPLNNQQKNQNRQETLTHQNQQKHPKQKKRQRGNKIARLKVR